MLNLPKRKSTFNFFESFSDLVFCTLVMFLVLVLFLAMNVNEKQEQVAEESEVVAAQNEALAADLVALQAERDRAASETEQARLIREEAERLAAAAELERMAQEALLAEQRALAERERLRYEQALGSRRFTDPPAPPRLVVAYQWEERRILVHPVPTWLVDQLNTTPAGLSDAQRAEYQAALRGQFLVVAAEVDPLTARQYRALVRGVSLGIEPMTQRELGGIGDLGVGFRVLSDGTPTTRVARLVPGGNAEQAGVLLDDELLTLDGEALTPETVPQVLTRYRPGDEAALTLMRRGERVELTLSFLPNRLVALVEAYRTDLSMVASGAVDAQYRYLWAPALADALRGKLQRGEASGVVWQNFSRTDDQRAVAGRPTLLFDVDERRGDIIIERERFSPEQFRRVLDALGGGGAVVEYLGALGPYELPEWVMEECLRPTGFVNRAPQLELLEPDAPDAE
ncbi:PDZ domain-containing protein [Phycisphaeraceae bacterium D3-23]